MKIGFVFLLTFCSLSFFSSCSSRKVDNPYIQREWMLVAFGDFTREELMKSAAGINLTATKENGKIKGSAFMGCNRIFFTSAFERQGKMKISGIGSTEMACPNMKVEIEFVKHFYKMKRYSIEGHFLTLSDEEGTRMKFIATDWD